MRTYVTEFIGTFFLVLTIGLTVLANSPMAPLAIGAALMVMVYMGGHVSGAHYNPAVTLAVFLRGKLAAGQVLPYWVAQIAGAIAAAVAAHYLMGSPGKTFGCAPGAGVDAVRAVLNEVLFTFALALVVLNVATSKGTTGNSFYGLAIGFTVVVGAFAGGGISGGAYNPAVGIGPIVYEAISLKTPLTNLWIYLVGPFVGGLLAAGVFRMQEQS